MSIEAHVTPSADRPLVSIIVVNFNGKQFLTECLNSAFDKAFKKYPFEIVVVDNCSQDGSQQIPLRARPDITYIESDTNTGFTGGNNLGVRAAKGELVFLLNNDTRVETCLDPPGGHHLGKRGRRHRLPTPLCRWPTSIFDGA